MGKKKQALAPLVIKDEELKVRKRQAPPMKVEASQKTYNRQHEKRGLRDGGNPRLALPGGVRKDSTKKINIG